GRAYLAGEVVDENTEQGLELLERAAQQEYAPALLALGRYYDEDASLFDRDKPRARTYLERASNLNNAEATYLLGQSYLVGEYDAEQNHQAVATLKHAAEL